MPLESTARISSIRPSTRFRRSSAASDSSGRMAMRASRAMRRIWSWESDIAIGGPGGKRCAKWQLVPYDPRASLAYHKVRLRNGKRFHLAHVWIPAQLLLERSRDRPRNRQHAHLRARQGDRARRTVGGGDPPGSRPQWEEDDPGGRQGGEADARQDSG